MNIHILRQSLYISLELYYRKRIVKGSRAICEEVKIHWRFKRTNHPKYHMNYVCTNQLIYNALDKAYIQSIITIDIILILNDAVLFFISSLLTCIWPQRSGKKECIYWTIWSYCNKEGISHFKKLQECALWSTLKKVNFLYKSISWILSGRRKNTLNIPIKLINPPKAY